MPPDYKEQFEEKKPDYKKISLYILLIILVLGVVGFLFTYKPNKVTNQYQYQLNELTRGEVTEVGKGFVTIKGFVSTSDSKHFETKTVKFNINSKTILGKTTFSTPPEQLTTANSGKPFRQNVQKGKGVSTDFFVGMSVTKAVSKDNLFLSDEVLATEINYIKDVPNQ